MNAPILANPPAPLAINQVTVISQATTIDGSIQTNDNIIIYGSVRNAHTTGQAITVETGGRVNGDLEAAKTITIQVETDVQGRLKAGRVIDQGTSQGEIFAQEHVQFGINANHEGQVTSREVVIEKGAIVVGKITTTRFLPAPGARFKGELELLSPEDFQEKFSEGFSKLVSWAANQ